MAHRGGRLIGIDTLRIALVLHVSSDAKSASSVPRIIQMLMRIRAAAALPLKTRHPCMLDGRALVTNRPTRRLVARFRAEPPCLSSVRLIFTCRHGRMSTDREQPTQKIVRRKQKTSP
jgi:hypothetical protein